MVDERWTRVWRIVAAVALAFSAFATAMAGISLTRPEEPVARTYGCAVYTEQGCAKFVVADGGELEMQSGSTLNALSGATVLIDDVTFTDTMSISAMTVTTSLVNQGTSELGSTLTLSDGDVVVADDVRVTAQAVITVTQDSTITATGTYQPLTSAGNVSTSSMAAGTAGDVLMVVNTAATTITISDTGTLKLSGDAALGQYDVLVLWSDGTNWIEVSETNN